MSHHEQPERPSPDLLALRRAGLRAKAELTLIENPDPHAQLSAREMLRALDRREGGAP